MESKKVFLFLLAVSLGCFSAGKEKPEEKADLNALVAEQLGMSYFKDGNNESLRGPGLECRLEYDENSRWKASHLTSDGKESSSFLHYDGEGRILSSDITGENLSFAYDDNALSSASLNGNILFRREGNGDKSRLSYANGTFQIQEKVSDTHYRTVSDMRTADFVTDASNGKPLSVIQGEKETDFLYDDEGNEAGFRCATGTFSTQEGKTASSLFGLQSEVIQEEDTYTVNVGEDSAKLSYVKNDSLTSSLIDGRVFFSLDRSDEENGRIAAVYSFGEGTEDEVYSLDAQGRPTEIHSSDGLTSFEYDSLGRLLYAKSPGDEESYEYDTRGNVTQANRNGVRRSFGYGNASDLDQLTELDGKQLAYDGFGNLLSCGNVSFRWAEGSHLTAFSDGKREIRYDYSPAGNLLSRTEDEKTELYEYSGYDLIASYSSETGPVHYFYDERHDPLGLIFRSQPYFYVHDCLGNIRALVDIKGNCQIKYTYSPWGEIRDVQSESPSLLKANRLVYKDYFYDYSSGQYLIGTRWYSPSLLRFLSRDSLERYSEKGSEDFFANLYAYALDNPISRKDIGGYSSIALMAFNFTISMVALSIAITLFYKAIQAYVYASSGYHLDNSAELRRSFLDFLQAIAGLMPNLILSFTITRIEFWIRRNRPSERHHIIAQAHPLAKIARDIWTIKCNKSINDGLNLVMLKYEFHRHIHTRSYFAAVNTLISVAYAIGKEEETAKTLTGINISLQTINDKLPF